MGDWDEATPPAIHDPKRELIQLVRQLVREYYELYGDWPSTQWLLDRINGIPG